MEGTPRVNVDRKGSRTSSGASARVRSAGSSSSWSDLGQQPPYEYAEAIHPSDSASRSISRRPSASRQPAVETRPEPGRRQSSRRSVLVEEVEPEGEEEDEEPRRRRSSRKHSDRRPSRPRRVDSRHAPSEESGSTVASEEWLWAQRGQLGYPPGHLPHPPQAPQSHMGYPPTVTSGPVYEQMPSQQALIHTPGQYDIYGNPIANAFNPQPQYNPFSPQHAQPNPLSPMSTLSSGGYFPSDPQLHPQPQQYYRPRPQSFAAPASYYGSEAMSPYSGPSVVSYASYGMHPPAAYAQPHYVQPPGGSNEDRLLAMFERYEGNRAAREEKERATLAAQKQREVEEQKKKDEIAAASKSAKEGAEKTAAEAAKKAKEEHEKKLKEAKEAKEKAEKKQKELEEEAKKLKPDADSLKGPIKFKDAVGRKFSFPFNLAKTWKGIDTLIKQAFLNVEIYGEQVRANQYELIGPDGQIILPQVWDLVIQPDWEITMQLWAQDERKDDHRRQREIDAELAQQFAALGLDPLTGLPLPSARRQKSTSRKDGKRRSTHDPVVIDVGPPPMMAGGPIPPPPNFPPGSMPDLYGAAGMYPPIIDDRDVRDRPRPKRAGSKTAKSGELPLMAKWFAGGSVPKSSRKR